jgi:hypothetical protein
VDEAAYEGARSSVVAVKLAELIGPLEDIIAALRRAAFPKLEYRARFWDGVFRCHDRVQGERPTRPFQLEIKSALLDWIAGSEPDFAKRPRCFRRTWDRHWPRWIAGGRCWEALFSALPERNKARGDALLVHWAADLHLIHIEVVKRDGILPLGYRAAYDQLSDDWRATHSKYSMPKIVRRAFLTERLKPEVDESRSAWRARMNGPFIRGDASDHEPGDWFTFDDCTCNSKVASMRFLAPEVCHDGVIFRPEGLFAMDRRSHCFLHWLSIERHYNSEHILRLYYELYARLGGLARIGFKIENGPWACRFAIGDGEARRHYGRPLTFDDALTGFQRAGTGIIAPEIAMNRPDFGLRISRALPANPRGKAEVECSFNMLQNLLRHHPTFVGFDERRDRMDRNQKIILDFKARVKQGDEDPRNEVPTHEEMVRDIDVAIAEFNQKPESGTLEKRSPAQWWDEALLRLPLHRLPDGVEHLLATHEKTVKVTGKGILLKLRGIVHPYADGPVKDWKGDDVQCLYNVFHPEVIWVKHPRVAGLVKLVENCLPKTTATKAQFAEVNGRISAFRQAAKVVSGEVRLGVRSAKLRDGDVSDPTKELGDDLAAAICQHETQVAVAARRVPKLERFAAEIGVEIPAIGDDRERVLRGLERKLALSNSTENPTSQP